MTRLFTFPRCSLSVFPNKKRHHQPTSPSAARQTRVIPDFTFRLVQLAEIPFDKILGAPAGILVLRAFRQQASPNPSLLVS